MFEKYVGRKETPKVSIEPGSLPEVATRTWQERADQNPEFATWFSGSVVSDSTGRPIPVFHGTRGSHSFSDVYADDVSEMGVHFGTVAAANDRFAHTFKTTYAHKLSPDWTYNTLRDRIQKSGLPETKMKQKLDEVELEFDQKKKDHEALMAGGVAGGEVIYPVFLQITNPVRLSDPGSFTEDNLIEMKKDLIRNFVTRDQVARIQRTRSVEELRETLIELGFDGIVYKNAVEGAESDSDSYIPIVGPEQIRSVFPDPEA